MHQTFYIDTDEEISSVIDRLRKSMSAVNYFVVPQRAIFLQSIVNLKLLKREAEKIGKDAIIVTHDEIGASMAQRAGIKVQDYLDEQEQPPELNENQAVYVQEEEVLPILESDDQEIQQKRIRLDEVGTSDFYEDSSVENKKTKSVSAKSKSRRIHVNSVSSKVAPKISGSEPRSSTHKMSRPSMESIQPRTSAHAGRKISESSSAVRHGASMKIGKLDSHKEEILEKMFHSEPVQRQAPKRVEEKREDVGGENTKKMIFGFIFVCLLVLLGVGLFLYVPSAKITLEPKVETEKIDVSIQGTNDTPLGNDPAIPIRVMDIVQDSKLSFDSSGRSASFGQKARGSVVIYNEFSNEPQQLMSTTRLQSMDGKIFRLSQSVTVPGTTVVGGETKPGAITAEIIADQPGSDYNIDPTTFSIPGFLGGPKFDKFAAKSTVAMSGGTSNSDGSLAVSQQDLDNAKTKTEADAKSKIEDAIRSQLQPGEVFLAQAEKIIISKSQASAKADDMVEKFDYNATASVHALVFSEGDVKKIVQQAVDKGGKPEGVTESITKIDYGSAEPDFDKNTLNLKVHGEISLTSDINLQQVKRELLGKDSSQIESVLKKYSSIKSVNVEINPTFVTRISQYPQRVTVDVSASGN